MATFWRFLGPAFPASRAQNTSDLHSKFALRPHHVWKYGRHPICDHTTWRAQPYLWNSWSSQALST